MAKLSQATRDAVRDGAIRSASAVLDHYARDHSKPAGVLDVGAGEGHWLDAAYALWPGSSMLGLDLIERDSFPMVRYWDADGDVELPLHAVPHPDKMHSDDTPETTHRRWPLTLCLEMAEHVSPASGDRLVGDLCRVAECVLWSAAIPGQGGDGHVNEQPPAYWNDRFNRHGWFLVDPFRFPLWGDERVEPWYRQNLLLAMPGAMYSDGRVGGPLATSAPPHLVHPATFQAKIDLALYWREEALKAQAAAQRLAERLPDDQL